MPCRARPISSFIWSTVAMPGMSPLTSSVLPSGIQAIGGREPVGSRFQSCSQTDIMPICACWVVAMSSASWRTRRVTAVLDLEHRHGHGLPVVRGHVPGEAGLGGVVAGCPQARGQEATEVTDDQQCQGRERRRRSSGSCRSCRPTFRLPRSHTTNHAVGRRAGSLARRVHHDRPTGTWNQGSLRRARGRRGGRRCGHAAEVVR